MQVSFKMTTQNAYPSQSLIIPFLVWCDFFTFQKSNVIYKIIVCLLLYPEAKKTHFRKTLLCYVINKKNIKGRLSLRKVQ
jgi:hypothetical protein